MPGGTTVEGSVLFVCHMDICNCHGETCCQSLEPFLFFLHRLSFLSDYLVQWTSPSGSTCETQVGAFTTNWIIVVKSESRSLGVEIQETIDFLVGSTFSMKRKVMHTVYENEMHIVRKSRNNLIRFESSSVPPEMQHN
jgi:hypothetical protein